jgi:glycerophosphoryl diester phosphodiesterase
MVHPFFRTSRRLVFAHRGGAALAPENTLAAFDAGLASGADGLELDVHQSRDGVAVVSHDGTLDRTTNLRGAVSQFTVDELARADAGYHFTRDGTHPFRGQGIGVPDLASVLARYRDTRIIVEMKDDSPDLVRATVRAIREAQAVERVCLGSFGWRALRAARAMERDLATSAARIEVRWALYRSRFLWPLSRAPYQSYQVPEISRDGTRVVSERFIAAAHRAGLAVQVWTINQEEDARRLLAWGADALITDRPDLLVPLVRRSETSGT